MKIIFDLTGRLKDCAFFAIYAGLRMYKEQKESEILLKEQMGQQEPGAISLPAAEAFCCLEELKQQHPSWYADAEDEYNDVYCFKK